MNRGLGNSIALGLVIIGASALVIATFLPFLEPLNAPQTVVGNTWMEQGGWKYLFGAVFIALGGIQGYRNQDQSWGFSVVLCLLVAVGLGSSAAREHLLVPPGAGGPVHSGEPDVTAARPGMALYVAGVGVATALVGSVLLRLTRRHRPEVVCAPASVQAPTKACPECAETMAADARKCKHCGYRSPPFA
jgi:Uncharacterised protein family UPF0547